MEGKEVKARVIIEVVGMPIEHVKNTLNNLIEKIKEDKELSMEKHEVFEPTELKDIKMFSAFIEADIKFNGIDKLIGFCFDFTPSSVEVLEPISFVFDARFLNCILNDFVTKLHRYAMIIRNLDAEYALLKRDQSQKEETKEEKKEVQKDEFKKESTA